MKSFVRMDPSRGWSALALSFSLFVVGCAPAPTGPSNSGGAAGGGAGAATGQPGGGATGASTKPEPKIFKIKDGKTPRLAYVTNGIASFWTVAEKGCLAAQKDLGVKVDVVMPPKGVTDQQRLCQDLLTRGVDGVAISPIDPDNQSSLLDEIASRTNLITHDSDAPNSARIAYIGMDNYIAGRMCGELVKSALPAGGKVMVFVGRLGQANARLRRQGLIDELLDRSIDSSRYDEPGNVLKGDKYTVLDTRTDDFDFAKAKAQAQDAISKYADLDCMVGLFAYNPPKILEAVSEAGKLGKIQIVAFDEDDSTLQGILDGHIHGTIVQNPYEYGYQSIKLLHQLATAGDSDLPESRVIDIPARKIQRDDARAFWDQLKQLTEPANAQ